MKREELTTIEPLCQFLEGTQTVIFKISSLKEERYQWLQHELMQFDYRRINKAQKGVVIRYLIKVSVYASRKPILELRKHFERTHAKRSSIGARRKPTPWVSSAIFTLTRPSGGQGKVKGVYHINAVHETRSLKSCVLTKRSVSTI